MAMTRAVNWVRRTKSGGLFGVGQQLIHGQLAVGAVAVFLVAFHGFERAQAAQFAFDRHAQLVGHVLLFLVTSTL